MDAVAMSVHVPDMERMSVLHDWMAELLKHSFADCAVFVGVNPSVVTEHVLTVLESYRAKFHSLQYAVTPAPLVVDSDVSGYQAAFSLLRKSHLTFRLIWLGHTKGGMNRGTSPEINYIKARFFPARARVTAAFEADMTVGTWSPLITIFEGLTNPWAAYFDFKLPVLPLFHVYTFLVMRGKPLQQFLSGANDSFFTTNLVNNAQLASQSCSPNRWLCEAWLGNMIWPQGYKPLWDDTHQWAHFPGRRVATNCANIQRLIGLQQEHKSSAQALVYVRD